MRISKSFLLAFFTILMLSTQAQWQGTASIYYNGGNVGIGTSTPATALHVNGDITAGNSGGGYHLIINDVATARWALGTGDYGFHIANDYTSSSSVWTERIFISKEGYVGIGTNDTKGNRLAVNGNAVFTKVTVKAYNNWPDYVFHTTYRLRPLSEVEQYIKQYHHLPEVPSAEEVKKNGLDVGDNQAILLKKIEELTLYIIQQNKRIEALESKLETVNKELNK